MAPNLSDLVANPWNNAIIAPSYSYPLWVLTVIGENVCHKIVSHILTEINRLIPLPNPNPLFIKSSNNIVIYDANTNYNTIIIALANPTYSISPYIPPHTYAIASNTATNIPANLFNLSYNLLSSSFSLLNSNILAPFNNYIIIPLVTIGDIPNSINDPLLLANIALIQ